MKVFISWSGNKSHKVGLVFRDWLPSVIQTIEPYVSSEDIDKGARWSSDIAKELEDSTFGLLCVTKENLEAPWLSFEAGALSKTMDKSFVTPFLFDIKRSEVNGPILQFQSTLFQKEDIRKLMHTLNKACGESKITDERLNKAFDVWYPNLEEELNKISDPSIDGVSAQSVAEESKTEFPSEILEEILDLSRDNQKLLRNPDNGIEEQLSQLKKSIDNSMLNKELTCDARRRTRKYQSMFMEELLHTILPEFRNVYGFLILISFLKDDFPWIYNMGKELVDVIQSDVNPDVKKDAIRDFNRLVEFSFDNRMMRDFNDIKKENRMFIRELPYFLDKVLNSLEIE